jgi:DNA-binding Lrp family transcriptional regulator
LRGREIMPKSSKAQIDADEKKVIRELQKNSKESIDKIAKKCGFSRQKIWRVVRRLEKNKTIWGYTAIVDNEKLDLRHYIILIEKTMKPIEKVANTIVTREIEREADEIGITIHASHYLHGRYDWQICFTAENITRAKKFCETLYIIYGPNIKELDLLEIIFSVKEGSIQNPHLEELKTFL